MINLKWLIKLFSPHIRYFLFLYIFLFALNISSFEKKSGTMQMQIFISSISFFLPFLFFFVVCLSVCQKLFTQLFIFFSCSNILGKMNSSLLKLEKWPKQNKYKFNGDLHVWSWMIPNWSILPNYLYKEASFCN